MVAGALMVLAAVAGASSPDSAWLCATNKVQICSAAGCSEEARPAEIHIYGAGKVYRLCIGSNCLDVESEFYTDGESGIVKFAQEAGYAQIFPDLSFVEVTPIKASIQLSYGQCSEEPPPIIRRSPGAN